MPAPAPTPTPTPTATAIPQPTVATESSAKVKFDTVPKAVEVWVGDEKLGVAPGPFDLPVHGVDVTLKAPGFAPKTMRVVPSKESSVKAALAPTPKPKAAGTIHKDLDDPFGNK